MADTRLCSIDGCSKPAFGRGWCSAHYSRWRSHGDPLAGRTSPGAPMRHFNEVVLAYEGDECLIWPFAKSRRGHAALRVDGVLMSVARLVCERVHGPSPSPDLEAAHECGNGHLGCVAKKHLSWKTRAENEADKLRHGTRVRGTMHKLAKLTEDDVRQIRRLAGTTTHRELAEKFGVSESRIGFVTRRIDWAWLD